MPQPPLLRSVSFYARWIVSHRVFCMDFLSVVNPDTAHVSRRCARLMAVRYMCHFLGLSSSGIAGVAGSLFCCQPTSVSALRYFNYLFLKHQLPHEYPSELDQLPQLQCLQYYRSSDFALGHYCEFCCRSHLQQ